VTRSEGTSSLSKKFTSIEVAAQISGSIEENDRVTPVDSINADFAKKLTKAFASIPFAVATRKGYF